MKIRAATTLAGRKSPLSAVFLNCCDSEGIAGQGVSELGIDVDLFTVLP